MKKRNQTYTHIMVSDTDGKDFLCPVESAVDMNGKDVDMNVCFETDVPGRYASNIVVQRGSKNS